MNRTAAVTLGAVLLLSGCELITGVREEVVRGTIGYPDNVLLTIPETVRAGQEFAITVRTLGPNGCWSKDRTDLVINGLAVTITPYDTRKTGRDIACTAMPVELMHTASLTLERTGVVEVTIRGRDGTVTESLVVE